jgi:MFS family permease
VVAMFSVGCAVGSFCSGMVADKFGRKKASIVGSLLYVAPPPPSRTCQPLEDWKEAESHY